MTEALVRRAAEALGVDVAVESAGFLSQDEEATPVVVEIMGERGLDISGHRSRIVTAEMAHQADLVVAMERRHVRDLALLAPEALGRIDTLGGMVERLQNVAAESPTARIAAATSPRVAGDMLGRGDDEVDDPDGKSKKVNTETADRLIELSDELLAGLFAPET
jgi:protein-tyrosine phosphatase